MNTRDRDRKGRQRSAKGSDNPRAVMTEAQVIEFRARYAAGETAMAISRSSGVSFAAVYQAVTRRSWKHI